METVLERPEIYMHEIRDTLISETGTSRCPYYLEISTNFKYHSIKNGPKGVIFLGLSMFKTCQWLSRNDFVDETGQDRRNCMRNFGYSMCGKPPVSKKFLVRGQRVSAIAAMSTSGIIDCHTLDPTCNKYCNLFLLLFFFCFFFTRDST